LKINPPHGTCSLATRSITNWEQFETTFLTKFGDERTPIALVLELYRMKMDAKERIKDLIKIYHHP
jgi:hypothetical protein